MVLSFLGYQSEQEQDKLFEREVQHYRMAVYYLKHAVTALEQPSTENALAADRAMRTSTENFKAASYRLSEFKVNHSELLALVQDTQQIVEGDVTRKLLLNRETPNGSGERITDMLARISKLAAVLPDQQFPTEEEATKINSTLEEIRYYE